MKEKTSKRVLSLLLTAVMTLGLLPTAAFAATTETVDASATWEGRTIEAPVTVNGSSDPSAPLTIEVKGTVTVKAPITVKGNVLIYGVSRDTDILRRGYGTNASYQGMGQDLLRVDTGASLVLSGLTVDGAAETYPGRIMEIKGSAELTGTTIRNAKTATPDPGVDKTLIYAVENATLVIGDGTLIDGANNGGGGTRLIGTAANSTVRMTGGTIRNCNGHAAIITGTGNFEMTGGAITGNTVKAAAVNVTGDITLSGGAQITGNTKSGSPANLYLADGKTVKGNGLTTGTIGFTTESPPTDDATIPVTSDVADPARFSSDQGYMPRKDAGGHVVLTALKDVFVRATDSDDNNEGTREKPLATLTQALKNVRSGGRIILLSSVEFDNEFAAILPTESKEVTITSDPQGTAVYTINCVGYTGFEGYAQFYINNNSSLTLERVTVDGNKSTRSNNSSYGDFFIGPIDSANQHSTLVLGDGATLQNFYPRAVNIRASGTVIMLPGSEIRDCEAGINTWYNGDKYNGTDGVGAAVYVCPNGTFDMRGGEIRSNTADGYTGKSDGGPETVANMPAIKSGVTVPGGVAGVFGEKGAAFMMSGAPVVAGNTGNGAAANVFLNDGQTIRLTAALTDGADVNVYVNPMPDANHKLVVIAESDGSYRPQSADAAFFHSDKATEAGVSYVEADQTVVLDYDQRNALDAWGIVKDRSGNPVEGAKVKVSVATDDGGYHTFTYTTGADGKYFFKGPNVQIPGNYTVYVDSGAGVASSTQEFRNLRPQQLADIMAQKADSGNTNIAGGIVSDFGKPVKGAAVKVINKADGSAVVPGSGSVLVTKDGGGYTVENLPDGVYAVETTTGDGKSGMTEIKVSGGQVVPNTVGGYKNPNLAVTPGSIVRGTVSGLAAGQTAEVSLNVPVFDENGRVIGTKTVTGVAEGPGGYWQIAGVPAGDYPVTVATPNGAVTGTATVDQNGKVTAVADSSPANAAAAGTDGKLNVAVPAERPENPNAVTGAVVGSDNKPIENARVVLYNDKGEKVGEAVTGEGGGYTVPNNLPDGKYYLSADASGKNGLTGPVELKGGRPTGRTTVTVSDTASKLLEGTVTKQNDTPSAGAGAPAVGATVVVKDGDGNVIATVKTNAYGQYFAGSVPAGATVSIVTPDGEAADFAVSGTTAEGAYNGDAQTKKPDAGSKPVIGPDGSRLTVQIGQTAPAGKAAISVTGPNGAAADANAKFEIDAAGNLTAKTGDNRPAPGVYAVTITDANGMKVTQTITVNGEGRISDSNPITIAARTVAGKAQYATGTVPADATVTVPGWGSAKVNTSTGEYKLTGIPDGEYRAQVTVTDSGKDPAVTSTVTVTLKLENGVAVYENPTADANTGASVIPNGSNLTVTPTIAVNGIADRVVAAKAAVDAAKTDETKLDEAVAAVKTAQAAIAGATEEELKQLDPSASRELAGALTGLLASRLTVAAKAEGMTNTAAVQSALNGQKGLLLDGNDLDAAAESGKTVTVTLNLKAEDVTADPPSSVLGDTPKVEAIASAVDAKETALFEIVVEKTTLVTSGGSTNETVTNVSALPAPVAITLDIPQDLRGFQYYGVVRVHNGTAERIPSMATAFTVTFASNFYSTYAILASNDPMFADDAKADQGGGQNPGGSGGGGGGGGGSAGTVQIGKAEHGTVSVDKSHASKGQTVTITVTPDKGYTLGSLTVTDKNGNVLSLTDLGNNKFSYIQPDAVPVTIRATFERTGGADYANCPKDETCPIYPFRDSSTTAWYHDGVHYCLDNGLMNGTGAATFKPNGTTTRGMIVAILYRLEGEPAASGASYPDVAAGMYYTQAVAWASAHGIVTGYNDGSFGPNNPITREQMAAILYRYAGYKGYDVSAKADLSKFSDNGDLSGYAAEALSWANAEGLVTGTSAATLTPRGQATRAQAATILMRFCENVAK